MMQCVKKGIVATQSAMAPGTPGVVNTGCTATSRLHECSPNITVQTHTPITSNFTNFTSSTNYVTDFSVPYDTADDYCSISREFNQQRLLIIYFIFFWLMIRFGQFISEGIRWLIREKPWRVERMYEHPRAHHPILRVLGRDPLPMQFQAGLEEDTPLQEGSGLLTLNFVMGHPELLYDDQAGEVLEQDLKRDRAKSRDRAQHKDLIRERNKAAAQIRALQQKKKRLDEKAAMFAEARKRGQLDFQSDDVSNFFKSVNEFKDKLSGGILGYIVDPNSVRDMVAIALQLELMYQVRKQPMILLRVVLIFVERVVPKGKFFEFAEYVTTLVSSACEQLKHEFSGEETDRGIAEVLRHVVSHARKETACAEVEKTVDDLKHGLDKYCTPHEPGPHDPPLGVYEEQDGLEWQDKIDDKIGMASLLMGSDALSMFKKLTGVVVALGMLPKDASLGGLKLFTKGSANACDSIEDVFTILVTSLDYCLKVGRKYLVSGDWKDLIFEDALQSVQGRMAKCVEMRAEMHSRPIDLHAFDKFLNESISFIKLKVKAESKPGQAILLRHIDQLCNMKVEVQGRLRSFDPTKACCAFNVYGGSSVGKSSVVHIISEVAAKALGHTSFKNTTTVVNSAAKHDDSFYPNTQCVYEDDVNAMQQAVVDNPQGINLMDLVNNWKKFCTKADIDSKGTVIKDAEFYICSSNSEKMFLGPGTMNLPEAAFRRIYALETKVKKEAQDVDGSLNGAYVAQRLQVVDGVPSKMDDSIWIFTLKKWDFRCKQYMPLYYDYESDLAMQDPSADSFKVENVDLTVAADVVRSIVSRNDSVQTKVVEFLGSETKNCPHNNFPELCRHCSPEAFEARKNRMKPTPLITVVQPPAANHNTINPRSAPLVTTVSTSTPNPLPTMGLSRRVALTLNVSPPTSDDDSGPDTLLSDSPQSERDRQRLAAFDYMDKDDMKYQAGPPDAFPVGVDQQDAIQFADTSGLVGSCYSIFGGGILDKLPWRTKCAIMLHTTWLWMPFLRICAKPTRTALWKVRACYVLLPLLVSLFLRAPLRVHCGHYWYLPILFLFAFTYLLYSLGLMSVRCLCVEESSRFDRKTFSAMLEKSVEVASGWKWQILGLCVSVVLAGLTLSRTFSNTLEEQNGEDYKPPFKSQQAWMKPKETTTIAAPSVSGATVEQILATVAEHSAYVTVEMPTGIMSCRAFCVGQGMWVTNAHFLLKAENRRACWRSAGNLRNIVIAREDWVYAREGSDIAVVHIRFPAAKDLSKFITKDIPTGSFPAIWLGVNRDASAQLYDLRCTLMPENVWRMQGTKGSPLFAGVMPVDTKLGMCGSVLLAVTNKTASIVGIHALGATGTPHAGFAAFNAFDIASAVKLLSQNLVLTPCITELSLLGQPVDLSHPIPMKSAVRHLDKGGEHDNSGKVVVLGGTLLGEKISVLRGKTKQSPIYSAVVEEFGEPTTGPCKHGQPEHISSQKALYHSSTDHPYCRKAYACAIADTRKFYVDKAKSGMFARVRPYTIEEAIQGLDERGFVNGLNWTSSMGMPWGGQKLNHSYVAENGKRMLNPEFVDIIEETIARLRVPNAPLELVGEFKYKDEATKLVRDENGCVRPKDSRVYTCYPVVLTVVIFMYFGPFGEVMNYNAEEYGAAVPLNMCSHDAKLVTDKALAFSPEEDTECVIDGDFEHFDQSSTPDLTVDTMSIDTECSVYSRYRDEDRVVMDNIAGDMSFPVEIVNGVAVVTAGMNTSGHSYTIHANNKNCRFYLSYGFYAKSLRGQIPVRPEEETMVVRACGENLTVPVFSKLSTWFTQGDDHIGTVKPYLRPYYNMQSLQKELAEVNIGYTDASKSAVNKSGDFMFSRLGRSLDNLLEFEGAEFLKRRFVKSTVMYGNKRLETVTAPIALRSITKSLYWKGTNEVDHEWVESVVHGQCREAALYGEEVYDDFKARLERVLEKSGMTTFASPIKSFNEQMQHYAEAICECYVAKDLSRDMVDDVPVFHESHQFAPRLDLLDAFIVRGPGVTMREVRNNYSQELCGRKCRLYKKENDIVSEEWTDDVEAAYLLNFPDPKKEIRTSLHRVGSSLYVPPPTGR